MTVEYQRSTSLLGSKGDGSKSQALRPLADAAGSTFMIDGNRGELLVVRGRSIANTMRLADVILENRESFVQHRAPRPHRRPEQYSLF